MRYNRNKSEIITEVSSLISNALAEDIGDGDITSLALINPKKHIRAEITPKEKGATICGAQIVKEVFRQVDKRIEVKVCIKDGRKIKDYSPVCVITGPALGILMAERTALNILGRLSGIATTTNALVKRVKKYGTKILDTRKTTPGLRILEKYAVRTGGGYNHRFGLFDQVLIKDNHIAIIGKDSQENFAKIIEKVKIDTESKTVIEIEVKSLKQLKAVLATEVDIVMLDNMSSILMRKAVKLRDKLNKRVRLEASGNINTNNIMNVARCGVDFISLGMLTHSARCIDFSLAVKGKN